MATLKFYKTHAEVHEPKFATEQSACFDLCFSSAGKQAYTGFTSYNKSFKRPMSRGNIFIGPRERIMVPTGLIMDIPTGYSVRLHARSGLSYNNGLVLANSEGIIDSDYFHEIYLLIYNMSDNGHDILNGEKHVDPTSYWGQIKIV